MSWMIGHSSLRSTRDPEYSHHTGDQSASPYSREMAKVQVKDAYEQERVTRHGSIDDGVNVTLYNKEHTKSD